MKSIDLMGKTFGQLLVLGRDYEYSKRFKQKRSYWKCLCKCCGKIVWSNGSLLISGKKISCKTNHLEDKDEAGFRMLFRNYSAQAKRRNLSFELKEEEFRKLTKQNCFYCGGHPKQEIRKENSVYIYNGIDRIDNSKGYELTNIVSCCGTCNNAKGTMSKKEFFDWIKRINNNISKLEIKE